MFLQVLDPVKDKGKITLRPKQIFAHVFGDAPEAPGARMGGPNAPTL